MEMTLVALTYNLQSKNNMRSLSLMILLDLPVAFDITIFLERLTVGNRDHCAHGSIH